MIFACLILCTGGIRLNLKTELSNCIFFTKDARIGKAYKVKLEEGGVAPFNHFSKS